MTTEASPARTDAQQSRNVFGTLTTAPDTKFLGTPEEEKSIIQVLCEHCPSITKLILQQETHKKGDNKGNIHYHFLVCTKSPLRKPKLIRLREALSTLHPGRHDVQFAKSVTQVEKYLFKECSKHKPYTQGYSQDEIDTLERIATDEGKPVIKTTATHKYEAEILEQVVEFMNTNHYKINFYTRAVHGRDGKDRAPKELPLLFEQLAHETTIPEDYGVNGVDLIRKYIQSNVLYALPYYTPNRDYITFNNAVYCFTEGRHYELDDPAVADITPIRHFDVDFPPPAPTAYMHLIHHHMWDRAGFVEKYGAMFRPKSHRDPCMYLWGPPLTGKTMFYIPLIEVLGDLVGNYTKDSNFSLANLPDKLVAVLDEVDIWSCEDLQMQLVKKLLEGTEFTVARKNRDPGVVKPIHAFIATNTKPPEAVDRYGNRDYHIEAILSRIHPYETRDLDKRDDNVIRSIAVDQAPGWAVFCTQTHPYIAVPSEYL